MTKRNLTIIGILGVVALLAIGVSSALAHGGRGGPFFGAKSQTDLITPAAQTLGVSADALKKAILDDANARIDAAVKAERIDADQAADLKDDLAANPQRAMRLTTATGVARALNTTKAKLDDAFRAARKAAMIAKIDQAVKDERITSEQANQMKAQLEDAQLPGYNAGFGFGRHGGGPGFGKHGFGFGKGMGSMAPKPAGNPL
jgi:hypothetical protein